MSKANHGLIKRRVPRRQPTRKGSKRRFKVKRERWTGDWHQIIREEARGTARHDTTRHSRMTIDTHRQKKNMRQCHVSPHEPCSLKQQQKDPRAVALDILWQKPEAWS